jgi:Flp pilus assembly protein TadG
MIARRFIRFLRDTRAVSAIEFAFTAPLLVAAVIGTTDAGLMTYRYYDMDAAVGSGAQYIMRGAPDITSAPAVVAAGWTTRTQGGTVALDQFCRCAGKIAMCTVTCPDGTSPQGYATLSATDTYNGLFLSKTLSASETVRVR